MVSVKPTAQTAGIELEVAAAGGEVIDACAGKQPVTKPKEGGPSIVHLQAPKNLDEAGYNNYRPRPKCSGSLWTDNNPFVDEWVVWFVLVHCPLHTRQIIFSLVPCPQLGCWSRPQASAATIRWLIAHINCRDAGVHATRHFSELSP